MQIHSLRIGDTHFIEYSTAQDHELESRSFGRHMGVEMAYLQRQENDLCNLMGWDRTMTWLLWSIWVGTTDDNFFSCIRRGNRKRQRAMLQAGSKMHMGEMVTKKSSRTIEMLGYGGFFDPFTGTVFVVLRFLFLSARVTFDIDDSQLYQCLWGLQIYIVMTSQGQDRACWL